LNGEDSKKGFDLLKPFGRIIHFGNKLIKKVLQQFKKYFELEYFFHFAGASSLTTENRSLIAALRGWWSTLRISSLDILSTNKAIGGYHLGYIMPNLAMRPKINDDLKKLFEMYENGQIKICIDTVLPFSKIGEAMHRMHARKNVGKIILVPDSELKN
jgi:NADPH:quinone reductase-like Zn-dependent oxidoreductase